MKRKVLILFAALFINNIEILAQLNTTTVGDAVDLGGNCFLITNNLQSQKGGVWYDNPIDFSNDFTINYQNNFGDHDYGADGMALVFKTTPDAVIGVAGAGLGYRSIKNSLIVEFDTHQNVMYWDLPQDHLSIMKNGNPDHDSTDNLAGPIVASSSNDNIEDGNFHEVKIVWDAAVQVFSVFFDCQLRLRIEEDIKNTIFFGDSSVYFGFVGATGGASNLQQVCFNSISFVDNLVIPENETICLGQEINIDTTIPSGISYSWSPTTGVSDANIANPDFSPIETTDYTVTITDNCGELTNYTVTIAVSSISTPIFTQIDPICSGETLSNLPSTSANGILGTWSPAMNNTATTTYTFTPGAGECSTDPAQMTVIVNSIITPTFTQVGAICAGETLSDLPVTSNNGVTGNWSPVINNTSTTTYTFTPDASETCVVSQSMTITVNPIRTPAFTQVDAICSGEALSDLPVTSNNGITGTWSPAINNTAITTYTFTPDASEICAVSQSMTITVNPIRTPAFTQVDAICNGEALSDLPVTSNNGITGTWLPAINNTATTTYTFTPDASEICAVSQSMTIMINPIRTPAFTQVDAICSGEALSDLPVISNNGITGTWSPALNNTATTTYTFVPDASETCAVSQSMTITVSSISTPIFTQIDPICSGETFSNFPSTSANGLSGTWSPAMNNIATTTYTFTPDVGDCLTDPAQMTVIVNPSKTPTFISVAPICSGAALSDLPTTSTNNISGTWLPAMNNMATTTYTFTPDASETCAEATTLEISVNPIIIPIFTQVDAICSGAALSDLPTRSTNNISGIWSPAMNNMATTTYTFTPDVSEICVKIITLEIAVNPIIIPIFTQVDAICSGAAFSDLPTTSNNGVLGGWSPAMNNTLTTTYTFIPDLSETCALNQRMTITVNQTVIPIFDPVAAICEGELLTNLPTTSKNGVLGGWSPAMNNMATTTYTFTPDASEICAEITTLEIGVHEIINSNLDVRIVVNKLDYNQSVEVDVANAVGFYEYKLDSGLWQDSNLFENLIVGKHSIAAREKSGCNMELTIWFLLIDYPRFFTPNGDGINDTWNVKGLESQPEAVITIFDRFGKTLSVFKADELGWNGKSARSNSYWFKVSYFEMEDRPKTVMLSFSLFR